MINQNLLLTGDDGYNLTNSLRFRSSASAYLDRTFPSAGNRKTYTLSLWVKRGILGGSTIQFFFGSGVSTTAGGFYFTSTDQLEINPRVNNTNTYITTTQVFRDPSAWYHIVVAVDTTQATDSNRLKLYVNGVQVTALSAAVYPALNGDSTLNNNIAHWIGRYAEVGFPSPFDGYLAEYNFIDGQALTPSSFGETSATTGVWIPKKYTGTYGTNGFYLPFTDNSALTTSSNVGLGKDFSGNANYWTTNNISITAGSTYDSMTDVPTLTSTTAANYCVLNPLAGAVISTYTTASNGNLTATGLNTGASVPLSGTILVSSGKWYAEFVITTAGSNPNAFGITSNPNDSNGLGNAGGTVSYGYVTTGSKRSSAGTVAYGSSYTTNDVIGIALDMDAGTLTFYKNNVSQGVAFTGLSGSYTFAGDIFGNGVYSVNFGQQPFSYTPPTGFVRLNTFNLPTPTIGATASTTANKYFDATTFDGVTGGGTVTNSGSMQPDFVWMKVRNNANNHELADSVRGTLYASFSNLTNAEVSDTRVSAFNSNGFSYGTNSNSAITGRTVVGWQWRASNATAVTNTAGSITSTVSASTTAGFSIVTYTGTGSVATIGHGLGVKPSMIFFKVRSNGTYGWYVYNSVINATNHLVLNTTAGSSSSSFLFNDTEPTSTVMTVGTSVGTNQSGQTFVAYCFAQIAGYSAFGSYTGNGSSDGPFVFTGFRPKFVMVKNTVDPNNWILFDTARNTYNIVDLQLYPNTSDAEVSGGSSNGIDFLSNGFKVRSSNNWGNRNGDTIIYACFAENPFKFSNAR
jgi:hypothetical protein